MPDKGFLTVGKDGFIKLSDFDTIEVKKSFRISDMPCSDVAQLTKEVFVVSGWDSCLHIFNLNYGSTVSSIDAHDDAVTALQLVPSLNLIATTSWDCTIRLWSYQGDQVEENYEVGIYSCSICSTALTRRS